MKIKKIISLFILPLFFSSVLFSQSLVELAKREKERREKLKGKKGHLVTNVDLVKLKKRPSISIPQPVVVEEEGQEIMAEEKKASPEKAETATTAESEQIEPQKEISDLEEKWKKVKEYSDLLSLKMNGLWQEFYSLDDMISRDHIQREISETYLKLLKSREDEKKAKEELDQARLKLKK